MIHANIMTLTISRLLLGKRKVFNTQIFTELSNAQVFYSEFHPITKEMWKYWEEIYYLKYRTTVNVPVLMKLKPALQVLVEKKTPL